MWIFLLILKWIFIILGILLGHTTGRALGAAMAFALELVGLLTDEQTAARTAEEIVWRT